MGDMSKEPSMEEILSSIKRIIAEDGEPSPRSPRQQRRPRAVEPEPIVDAYEGDEEILELTDEVEAPMPTAKAQTPAPQPASDDSGSMLSAESEVAARQALASLSSLVVKPQPGEDNTLEGLVRSMLRPMLKEWLDANLPGLVREIVAKEVARITGR